MTHWEAASDLVSQFLHDETCTRRHSARCCDSDRQTQSFPIIEGQSKNLNHKIVVKLNTGCVQNVVTTWRSGLGRPRLGTDAEEFSQESVTLTPTWMRIMFVGTAHIDYLTQRLNRLWPEQADMSNHTASNMCMRCWTFQADASYLKLQSQSKRCNAPYTYT